MSFHFFTSVSFFTPLLLPYLSEGILPDEVYNVHSRPCFGNGSTRSKEFSCAPGIYAEKHVTNQPFRLDGDNGIVIDPDVFLDFYFHHRLLVLLVHGESSHPPNLNTQHIHRTAGSQAAHRGESGEERVGIVAKQGNMAEFHRHIPNTEQTETEKDADCLRAPAQMSRIPCSWKSSTKSFSMLSASVRSE